MLSLIRRGIELEGPLNEQDRSRLVEIADRCPVHRTLSSEIAFETTET
jgi:putative redox protein